MNGSFLLNTLIAYGCVGSAGNWRRDDNKRPRGLARYLASRRVYGSLHVQPVIVPQLPGQPPLSGSLGSYDGKWGYISTGRYQVTLTSSPSVDLLDALHGALALANELEEDEVLAIPLEQSDMPKNRVFDSKQLRALLERKLPAHLAYQTLKTGFSYGRAGTLPGDDIVWRLCDRLLASPVLTRAALYLRSAVRQIYLVSGPVDDAHERFEEMPSRILEQVVVESSIQDCLKAIETLYGGRLSANDGRLRARVAAMGLDPDEQIGFARSPYRQATVIEKIRALRDARDARAAHGGTAESRRNSLYDLCDYQHLASAIVWSAVCVGDKNLQGSHHLTLPLHLDDRLLTTTARRRLSSIGRRRRPRRSSTA
jgi:hypothetical protein